MCSFLLNVSSAAMPDVAYVSNGEKRISFSRESVCYHHRSNTSRLLSGAVEIPTENFVVFTR